MTIRRNRIRRLVDELLHADQLDRPPVPVRKIIEKHGVKIVEHANQATDISGLLFRHVSEVVIGVNIAHNPARQRFTLAHEFGHFLLHGVSSPDALHIDRGFVVRYRDSTSSQGTDDEEREANLFAAELLMPRQFLQADLAEKAIDLVDNETVEELAARYQVSTQAMAFRLANQGYLTL